MNFKIYILFILSMFAVSSSPLIARHLIHIDSISISFWRMLIASLILIFLDYYKNNNIFISREPKIILAGSLLGIHFCLFYTAISVMPNNIVNATVFGTKTFKTVTSVTPSSNSTGSITVGTTGAGITTTGVTGSATLDGVDMTADISNNIFSVISGSAAGLKVKYSGLGASGSIFYGQSLIDKLTSEAVFNIKFLFNILSLIYPY